VSDREQLEMAIAAQERLRGSVPDEIVDAAVAALRDQLQRAAPVESAAREPAERRRQVTVLFADLSGFTAMSSELDAEVVADSINRIWARVDAVIAEHGGHVDKHIGDAVMAVWGVRPTREDDPERAVRAALALQTALAGSQEDGIAESRFVPSMRVGINTGPVHLGAVAATTEFTAMGDTVNVASRVQALAPAGGVLVTHDTYRHVRGVFDVQPVEAAHVKGKREPLRLYVVERAKARSFHIPTRGIEGVETATIGRDAELGRLRQEFEVMLAGAGIRRATVIGEAGVGKSRLLYELESWIDLHRAVVFFFKGRALADRSAVAFGLARDVLAARLGVLDSDASADVAAKLVAGMAPALTADEAALVGHWLGFDLASSEAVHRLLGSPQLATTARSHLFRYFEHLAAIDPVVVFLEDLHWADEETLGLLDDLVELRPDLRLLIVGVARPSLFERVDETSLAARSTAFVRLAPLSHTASRALAGELLQRAPAIPEPLLDLIADRSDGNAYFAEELVKMLIEDGVIDTTDGDTWAIVMDRFDPERVPATLTGVLQSRLDSLAPSERAVLQQSSVVGRVFWDRAVATIGGAPLEPTSEALQTIHSRELVFPMSRSSFEDCRQFAFKHALLRDVTYETVLLRDRRRLHAMVADWVRAQAGERVAEYAGMIAAHLRLAGRTDAAAEQLSGAAAASLAAGNSAAARRLLDQAFGLWRTDGGEPPVSAVLDMTEACMRVGDIEEAYRHSLEGLRRAGAARELLRARYLRSWVASERAETDVERAMLDAALPDAEAEDGELLALVLTGLAWMQVLQGEFDAAERNAVRAMEIAQRIHHPLTQRQALHLLGSLAASRGDLVGAARWAEAGLAFTIEIGDLEGQSMSHANCGVARHLIGDASGSRADYLAAREHYERADALSQQLGLGLRGAMNAGNLAQIHVRLGDLDAARAKSREAIEGAIASGAQRSLLFCVLLDADRRLTAGDRRALTLLGLVRAHPAASPDTEREITAIVERTDISPDELDRLLDEGARLDLDETVAGLLADLDRDPAD
jgi:class 3 adenylate cyclase/tetratricopeptide (TPR) repeat protein